jgi:2-succinyl-5-enolpyruvyl-6-hydroxy-3-cyclohexene-1-carboxylate synthase
VILRIGGSPTSASLLAFLEEQDQALQIVVDEGHRWKDHLASAQEYHRVSPPALLDRLASEADWTAAPGWSAIWAEAEARTRRVLENPPPGGLLEGEILAAVVQGLPEGANLLAASSMPIRDLDAFGFPGPENLRVFGNRGASGIDGLVSTTLGIAAASEGDGGPARPTVGVLGDLAFFHDMNGLLATKGRSPWVVFVVVNNDGGGIFHTLPVRKHEPAFTRFFATPHGLDFQKAAELYGIPHTRVDSLGEFGTAFPKALGNGGPVVLEVRTNREETHDRRRAVVEAVVASLSGLADEESWIHDRAGTEDEIE